MWVRCSFDLLVWVAGGFWCFMYFVFCSSSALGWLGGLPFGGVVLVDGELVGMVSTGLLFLITLCFACLMGGAVGYVEGW